MSFRITNKFFIGIFIGMAILLGGCSWFKKSQESRALFSWKSSVVTEGDNQIFTTMKEHNLNTLYQGFSKELKEEDILEFLGKAQKEKVGVHMLVGDPEWALEQDGKSMCQQIDKAIDINSKAEENQGVKGIIFDVEPYLLEEWDNESSSEIMDRYVEGMKTAYEKAKKSSLQVILCMPYFYDDLGVSEQLEDLIKSGCDSIAVMNYYQGKESENIEKEVELADKYDKKIVNIYELQSPGEHGLKDKNTYYEEGVSAVEENFASLKSQFKGKDISIAFHEYEAFKEVIGRE